MQGSSFVASGECTRAPIPFELALSLLTISFQTSKPNKIVAWGHLTILFSPVDASRTNKSRNCFRSGYTFALNIDCVLTGHQQSRLDVHISYGLVHTPIAIPNRQYLRTNFGCQWAVHAVAGVGRRERADTPDFPCATCYLVWSACKFCQALSSGVVCHRGSPTNTWQAVICT